MSRSTGASLVITAAGHVISGRRSVCYGADCFISAGRSVYHGVGDVLRISRWHPAETCGKTLVIRRLAQPDGKRPGAADPLFQELPWPFLQSENRSARAHRSAPPEYPTGACLRSSDKSAGGRKPICVTCSGPARRRRFSAGGTVARSPAAGGGYNLMMWTISALFMEPSLRGISRAWGAWAVRSFGRCDDRWVAVHRSALTEGQA